MKYFAILFLCLILVITVGKYWQKWQPDMVKRGEPVLRFNIQDVKNVLISEPGSTAIAAEFTWREHSWYNVSPWQDRADHIGFLVQASANMKLEGEFAIGKSAASYHLAKKARCIILQDKDKQELARYWIGKKSPWQQRLVIKKPAKNGKKATEESKELPCFYIKKTQHATTGYLVYNFPVTQLQFLANDLVRLKDYRPFNLHLRPYVKRIEISHNDNTIGVYRDNDKNNEWYIDKPLACRLQPMGLKLMLSLPYLLYANDITKQAPPHHGNPDSANFNKVLVQLSYFGQYPTTTLTLWLPKNNSNTAIWGKISSRPHVWLKFPAERAHKQHIVAADIPENVNQIRSRNLLDFITQAIQHVTLQKNNNKITLYAKNRGNDTYYFQLNGTTKSYQVNPTALQKLWQFLQQDIIVDFATDFTEDLEKYGLKQPWLTINLTDRSGQSKQVVIGQITQNGKTLYYAKVKGENSIYQITEESIAHLPLPEFSQWATPYILNFPQIEVQQLTITQQDKSKTWNYDFYSNSVTAQKGNKTKIMPQQKQVLLSLIKKLTALQVVTFIEENTPLYHQARDALFKQTATQLIITRVKDDESLQKIILRIAPLKNNNQNQWCYIWVNHSYFGQSKVAIVDKQYFQLIQQSIQ